MSPPSLKALAIGYLSRREYSRLELRKRLLASASTVSKPSNGNDGAPRIDDSSGVDTREVDRSSEVDVLLDWLESQGYLSDLRFVESRVNARAARHGTLRIRQELSRHGLQLDEDQAAVLRATEFARAQAVWERKFGTPAADARGRAAQARFLSGRGFGGEVIWRIVGGLERDGDGDDGGEGDGKDVGDDPAAG